MARAESLAQGGYYAFPSHHLPAVAQLFTPAPTGARLLDPCAGEGEALQVLSQSLNLKPFAVEIEPQRAKKCQALFSVGQALHADLFDVDLSLGAMQMLWVNPPFTWDTAVPGKRREAGMLQHCWQWLQPKGWLVFVSYTHHLNQTLAWHIAEQASQVEIFRLPEKHFDTYTYSVLVAQRGKATDPAALANRIQQAYLQPEQLPLLAANQQPRSIPPAEPQRELTFHRRWLNAEDLLPAIVTNGADRQTAFQVAVQPPPENRPLRPILRPKLGHLVTLVAGGLFNYLPLTTEKGRGILRSKIQYVEELVETQEEAGKGRKEVYQLRPKTTITLLHEDGTLDDISTDTQLKEFMSRYKEQLFAYAAERFQPLYNLTGNTPEKRRWLPHFQRQRVKGKHRLFPAQMHVGAAICTTLEHQQRCLFIGEMSTGKTAVSIAVMDAWFKSGKVKPGQVMFVTCPSHLVKKWAREVHLQLPTAQVTTLVLEDERGRRDILADLGNAMRQAECTPQFMHVLIAAQDAIKLGEGWTPAYQTHVVKRHLICPTTGEKLQFEVGGMRVAATPEGLATKQHTSADRRYAYWQEARKFGLPKGHNGRAKKQGGKVVSLVPHLPVVDGWVELQGVYAGHNPRGPVWRLLEKRYRKRIAIAFFDEAHGSKDIASDRYRSLSAIARCADNIVALTGTIFNGYASSLYGLETVFNPDLFRRYPWGSAGINQFVRDMGVLEKVIEYKDQYTTNGTYTGVKRIAHGVKEKPGASPLLIQLILDHAVFLSLKDLGQALPPLDESPVPIAPASRQQSAYDEGQQELKEHLKECRKQGDASFLGAYFHSLLAYPDTAFNELPVIHRQVVRHEYSQRILSASELLVHTFPALDLSPLPKEAWLVEELVKAELAKQRGVAVFVTQTDRRDYQPRLAQLLSAAGANPTILYSDTVKPIDREGWIEKQFASGKNVLICNPRLVETGLDLIMCPTLVFFEPEYQLAVLAQAARRHWRIPQTQPCKTFYVYYTNTIQEQAMNLITEKLASLSVVNGESASLSALSQVGDLLKELMQGDIPLRDLRAEFAILNQQRLGDDAEWAQALLAEHEPPATVVLPAPLLLPRPVVVDNTPPATKQLMLPLF
jgi:hypothetical protein